MIIKNTIGGTLVALALVGCATTSDEIVASYVSPIQFERMSCRQIGEEASRVSTHLAQAAGIQDRQAEADATNTAISLILFWPSAFFIKGDQANSVEVARLKGELNALEQVSGAKNCGIIFHAPVEETAAE